MMHAGSLSEITKHFDVDLKGAVVVDYGCGYGRAAIEAAAQGARLVIGVDIRDECLQFARTEAALAGLKNCVFVNGRDPGACSYYCSADIVLSIDAFEHYTHPDRVLEDMTTFLKLQGGTVYVSFGPPWWHPYGAHLQFLTKLPWVHLLMPEAWLMDWRACYKHDGAKRFEEVEGGLNRMSLRKFKRLIQSSPFRLTEFRPIPIRRCGLLQRLAPEFFTSVVKAKLERHLWL